MWEVRRETWERNEWLLFLKLVGEKITQSLGHGAPAGPEGETVHLGLWVGLQSEEAADLSVLGVNDAGAHKVGRVGINGVQQGHTEAQDLGLGHLGVHRVLRFEDLLNFLLWCSQLLPSLEKVLGHHLCGLEKLVEHHWKFHRNVLESAAVSELDV